MRILVCMKQVPQLDQVRFDRANRIVREDVENVCNPLDAQALGHALELRGEAGEVVAVTMGPPAARAVLEEAIQRGADRAIHLTDRRFKGADTLATARALAEIVHREEPDIVLFGRSTLDGATAQLGQQVAELAHLPQVTEVVGLCRDGERLLVERETDCGRQTWQAPLPAAATVARGPLPLESRAHREGGIAELTAEDLGGKPLDYGTRGSLTFVKEVRMRELEPRRESAGSTEEAAEHVRELFSRAAGAKGLEWRSYSPVDRDVWVLADRDGDVLDPGAFEGLACARSVAGELNARVSAVLLAVDDEGASAELAARGADRVVHIRDPRLRDYGTSAYAAALTAALERERPFVLVAPWTPQGRDYVPRVAARLGLGLTGDVTGVEVENGEKPRLLWVKPAWAGTAEALVISRTTPTVATLRPGSYRPLAPKEGATAEVQTWTVELAPEGAEPRLVSSRREVGECLLDRGGPVFCVGSDVTVEAAEKVIKLAERWGVGVGGTADAVRQGLVPPQWELGILKRSIAPAVCVGLGIRKVEELAPMRRCSELVLVHPDADVPAHGRADLRVVADVEAFLKALGDPPA